MRPIQEYNFYSRGCLFCVFFGSRILLSEQVCEDWIVAGAWLVAAPRLPAATRGPGVCARDTCGRDFILLTAHSALLRSSGLDIFAIIFC